MLPAFATVTRILFGRGRANAVTSELATIGGEVPLAPEELQILMKEAR